MGNFLVDIEQDTSNGSYRACFLDGQVVQLNATNYHDAVLEADLIDLGNYELGYN